MPEKFEEMDFEDLSHVICPNCGHEASDHHNGGDPRPWWNNEYCPDGDLKNKCSECGQVYRVSMSWSPHFKVVPVEHDTDFEDYDTLQWG